jgi:hypothetical protein
MATTTDTTITFTPEAIANITAMTDELSRIRSLFGDSDPQTLKAALSLARSLAQLLMLRPTRVTADGKHSLCGYTDFITFGVNYTGTSYNEHGVGEWSVNS